MENLIISLVFIAVAWFIDRVMKMIKGDKAGHDDNRRAPIATAFDEFLSISDPESKPEPPRKPERKPVPKPARPTLPHEGTRVTPDLTTDDTTPPMSGNDAATDKARAAHYARWRQAMVDSWLLERKF